MTNMTSCSRRQFVKAAASATVLSAIPASALAQSGNAGSKRPAQADRKFSSRAVEEFLAETSKRIGDPELASMFNNCFPNTLDTTVQAGSYAGKPDTAVLTGDIAAMWLRDSS